MLLRIDVGIIEENLEKNFHFDQVQTSGEELVDESKM